MYLFLLNAPTSTHPDLQNNSHKTWLSLLSPHRPPDNDFLKSAREQRLKEVRMSEILKEIVTYFLFVLLLLMVAYGNRDPNAYLLRKNLHDIFVDVDQTGVDLADVCIKAVCLSGSVKGLLSWLYGIFMLNCGYSVYHWFASI